jgi:hypothetical protein
MNFQIQIGESIPIPMNPDPDPDLDLDHRPCREADRQTLPLPPAMPKADEAGAVGNA